MSRNTYNEFVNKTLIRVLKSHPFSTHDLLSYDSEKYIIIIIIIIIIIHVPLHLQQAEALQIQ
jgi:hypothetical protein